MSGEARKSRYREKTGGVRGIGTSKSDEHEPDWPYIAK